MDYKQLEKKIEEKINPTGKITKETMDNDKLLEEIRNNLLQI